MFYFISSGICFLFIKDCHACLICQWNTCKIKALQCFWYKIIIYITNILKAIRFNFYSDNLFEGIGSHIVPNINICKNSFSLNYQCTDNLLRQDGIWVSIYKTSVTNEHFCIKVFFLSFFFFNVMSKKQFRQASCPNTSLLYLFDNCFIRNSDSISYCP